MQVTVTPANIVAGALVSQVSVVAIMFVAAALIHRRTTLVGWYKARPTYSASSWLILVLFLSTVGVLAASDPLAASWRPLFGTLLFRGLSWSTAILLVFLADIIVVTRLVAGTGGSQTSPFQPLYFLLPTLALFLREPAGRVVLYACLVGLSFWVYLFSAAELPAEDAGRRRLAYGVVSFLCLGLACFIGIFTRQS